MTAPQLRQIDEDTYPGFVKNLDRVFGFDYNPEEDTLRPLLDLTRSFGHIDDGRVVSTVAAFDLDMAIPGASVPCGGTTVITVAPTHRRRGLLREMIDRHLADIREREEPIAALWASESEIYGRFGYGRATQTADITIHGRGRELSPHAAEPAQVRMIDPDEAARIVPAFHDRYQTGQPGMFKRSKAWWDARIFSDLPSRRGGYTAMRWAVVDRGDGIDGYARYRVKGQPGDDGHSGSEMQIAELFAATPEAWAGLWSFLLNQDLIARFAARLRPEDDLILDLLAGPRRAQMKVTDGMWVRIMDVPAAMTARSYRSDFDGLIQVDDDLGLSGGTFRLTVGPDGASCVPSTGEPDIRLSLQDLGSVYLGRPGLTRMARAGRVRGDHEVLVSADLALGWDPLPWCPEIF